MTRLYEHLETKRRAALVQFTPRCGTRPARYTLRWLDSGELFDRDGARVVAEFEHVEGEVKVEVGRQ